MRWNGLSGLVVLAILAIPRLSAQSMPAGAVNPAIKAHIPFVGCLSDGQAGPLDAPAGHDVEIALSPELASQFAYYQAQDGPGVLAPRGWHCFSTYGSNGSSLFVAPEPIHSSTMFSGKWKGFAGNVIQISVELGDTSGRFEVASVIARLFPAYMAFVKHVIDEGIEPASDFPRGPYPHDKVTYKSKDIVEYVTPAQTDGMGTQSHLQKNATSIAGAVILTGSTPDLVSVNVRLPARLSRLTSIILEQAEKDALRLEESSKP